MDSSSHKVTDKAAAYQILPSPAVFLSNPLQLTNMHYKEMWQSALQITELKSSRYRCVLHYSNPRTRMGYRRAARTGALKYRSCFFYYLFTCLRELGPIIREDIHIQSFKICFETGLACFAILLLHLYIDMYTLAINSLNSPSLVFIL